MIVYILGSKGRMGQSLIHEYGQDNTMPLDRSDYERWSQPNASDLVSRFFEKRYHNQAIIFVASGLLDPNLPNDDLMRVNYHLPKNVIDGAAQLGIKVVTFGTVMETLLRVKNPYVQSKTALCAYVHEVSDLGWPILHLQIHTLFGVGLPSPFMFLGQILAAIRCNQLFRMTSGEQLREYHHLMDDAKAIKDLTKQVHSGVVAVSHGQPLSLKMIAESIFKSLGKSELLHRAALPDSTEENYSHALKPVEAMKHIAFRDSLPAIIQYMHECYRTISSS